ncbi:MAG TPA: metallophosphoesterase family protein [Pseudolabrys sp.]|nr:metallophosphoesterase family protein [Pseudolabrys sp.]
MLIALFADIHANRQAFSACIDEARANGARRFALLGDYVGYGADPEWAVETVMSLAGNGAPAVLGNHDCAVSDPRETMNIEAKIAIEWTRGELGRPARDFLARLPLTASEDDRLYVHADASNPRGWGYVASTADAARSIQAAHAQVSFCGHIHRPAVYSLSATAKMTAFTPVTGVPIPLLPGRRWLIVAGSVGQPRDGDPAASWLMLDTDKREVSFRRTPYDIDAAAAAIRAKGLPDWLADRLYRGT